MNNTNTPAVSALMQHLFDLLSLHGGKIVGTASLTSEEIDLARRSGRLYVGDDSLGFAWIPDAKCPAGLFPKTPEEVKQFKEWYPLRVPHTTPLNDVPEEPVLVTEDGVTIFRGGTCWIYQTKEDSFYSVIKWENVMAQGMEPGEIYFSTREQAMEYRRLHVEPMFSVNDLEKMGIATHAYMLMRKAKELYEKRKKSPAC